MPYIEYAVNKEYIAKYLCIYRDIPGNKCQGTCYLHKQLQKNSESNKTDQNGNKANNSQNDKIDDHIMTSNMYIKSIENTIILLSNTHVTTIADYSYPVFVPPNFI